MPDVPLLTAVAIVALACALLLAPGWAMLRVVGFRGLLPLALAPACSTAVLGSGAIVAGMLGVRWGGLAAVGSVAAAVLLALGVRLLGVRGPDDERPRGLGVAGLVAGVLVAAVPVLAAAGSVGAYLQRWDAVFHLAALRLIDETGSASSLTLGALSYGDGRAAVYPGGWHALASLLPGSPTAVLVLGSSVTAAVPWVLGCAAMATQIWTGTDRRDRLVVVGAVLAGAVTSGPMNLWVGWGHVPNAAGLAMVPAAVALALRLTRQRGGRVAGAIAMLVALAGMGLAHPNAALACGVLLLPLLARVLLRRARADRRDGRRVRAVLVPLAAAAVLVLAAVGFLRSPLAAAVTGYAGTASQTLVTAILDLVSGHLRLWPSPAGVAIGLLGVVGAVLAAQRRRWPMAAMLGLVWLLYLDAATGGYLQLARLWYTSAARVSVVVSIVTVPLAAGVVVLGLERARTRLQRIVALLLAAVLAVMLVLGVSSTVRRAGNVFQDEPGHPPQFVTTGELAMIATLPDVTDGTILGSPFSGAASAYGLVGVPVTFPVAGQVWSPDQQLVMDNLGAIAAGTATPEVCAAVDRLDIRYLYTDSEPYQVDHRYEALDVLQVPGGEVVAEGDTAQVIALPPCEG